LVDPEGTLVIYLPFIKAIGLWINEGGKFPTLIYKAFKKANFRKVQIKIFSISIPGNLGPKWY